VIAVIYNELNKLKMQNEFSSLKFQRIEDLCLFHIDSFNPDKNDIIITDNFDHCIIFPNNKIIIIISEIKDHIYITEKIILFQYESTYIKEKMESNWPELLTVDSIIINCIPNQKLEIKPLDTQDATIYFSGIDKPENMVDEMFELDTKVHYEIKFYKNDSIIEPSKLHRLSWNVTTDINFKGIISYKIIREIENGSLPILLKENIPKYFFAYPFIITLEELKNKELLVGKVKEISSFIAKMTKDEFKSLANSIYKGIYVSSNWKYNFFLIAEKIRDTA